MFTLQNFNLTNFLNYGLTTVFFTSSTSKPLIQTSSQTLKLPYLLQLCTIHLTQNPHAGLECYQLTLISIHSNLALFTNLPEMKIINMVFSDDII